VEARLLDAQKVALLMTKKIMEDSAKDMRDLARYAAGLPKAGEEKDVIVMTDGDKKDLKERKEEQEKREIQVVATSASGPRIFAQAEGNQFGCMFGQRGSRGTFGYQSY
jgi:hypothetical protein